MFYYVPAVFYIGKWTSLTIAFDLISSIRSSTASISGICDGTIVEVFVLAAGLTTSWTATFGTWDADS
jgi:hypothetical protein